MSVEPGGYAEAVVLFLRKPFHHLPSRGEPSRVCCLHGPRSSSAEHAESLFREPFAQQYDVTVVGVVAQLCMSAHDAHTLLLVMVFEEVIERGIHPMVVEGACQFFLGVSPLLPRGDEVVVDFAVEARIETLVYERVVSLVEVMSAIQCLACHVVWHLLEVILHSVL